MCRDPDKAKGEKLRECLWADPEAGIFDYQTARDIFKKQQAELRAKRGKPINNRRQQLQASTSTSQLPRTSKPLDLLPPLRTPSTQSTRQVHFPHEDQSEVHTFDGLQLAIHPPDMDEQLPRIHKPILTYVAIESDDEEKAAAQSRRILSMTRAHVVKSYTDQSPNNPVPRHYADANARVSSMPVRKLFPNASGYYTSAYDKPPTPPVGPIYKNQARQRPSSFTVETSTAMPKLATSLSPSRDESESPRRSWAKGRARITSVGGYQWKPDSWKPADSHRDEQTNEVLFTNGHRRRSQSPSSVSYVSIGDGSSEARDHHMSNGPLGGADKGKYRRVPPDVKATGNVGGLANNARRCKAPTNDYADLSQSAKSAGAADDSWGNRPYAGVYTDVTKKIADVSEAAGDSKSINKPRQSSAITFPGEITIQEDEEVGTSDSDSELTSDEGKLKSLPPKLRKVLSRSRITKVIIGDEVFEIRPKTNSLSTRIQKREAHSSEVIRAGIQGKYRISNRNQAEDFPSGRATDNADPEQKVNTTFKSIPGDTKVKDKHTPLKIKLIFNRKPAADSKGAQPTATNTPAHSADVEMEDACGTEGQLL